MDKIIGKNIPIPDIIPKYGYYNNIMHNDNSINIMARELYELSSKENNNDRRKER